MGSLKKVGGRERRLLLAHSVDKTEAGGVGGSSGDYERDTPSAMLCPDQSEEVVGLTVMSVRSFI